MTRQRRAPARPYAVAVTAALILTLPTCQGRRRASSSARARDSDHHEFVISVSGDPGIPFSGSYRVFRPDSTTLQQVNGVTPASYSVEGRFVSIALRKLQAEGEVRVRILEAGCNSTWESCVDVGGDPFFVVAVGSTTAPFGMILVSTAGSAVHH